MPLLLRAIGITCAIETLFTTTILASLKSINYNRNDSNNLGIITNSTEEGSNSNTNYNSHNDYNCNTNYNSKTDYNSNKNTNYNNNTNNNKSKCNI